MTIDKLDSVRQPASSSVSNSGASSPRGSLSGGDNQSNAGGSSAGGSSAVGSSAGRPGVPAAAESDSESEEERLQLNHRRSPVNAVDVSSLAEF